MNLKRLVLLLAVLAAGAYLATRWPRVNEATAARDYRAPEERVAVAAKAVVERLSGFRFVGSGSGAGGRALQAVYKTLPGLEHDVTLRIRREGGATRVSVKSKSRSGPIDLGQNARILEQLLAALDRELGS
jgi:hypothetical protein